MSYFIREIIMVEQNIQEESFFQIRQTPEFEKWFKKLKDWQAKKKINVLLLRIKNEGFFGEHRGVGDNVSELKVHIGAGYRVYYTIQNNTVVLLLCGGDKNSQDDDIIKAKLILKNWSNDDDH